MQVQKEKPFNPIMQDTKKGALRYYTYGASFFNYGMLPQTWEDPKKPDDDTGFGGDNDPIDACEIGTKIFRSGSVVKVKVLGCLSMIDDGELDWKVIAINAADEHAVREAATR